MTTIVNPFRNMALAIVATAMVLGFATVPAEAAEVRTVSVATSQQELGRADGRQAVERRVLAAAETLCSAGGTNGKNLAEAAAYKLCVATALRDARQQMAAITARTELASIR